MTTATPQRSDVPSPDDEQRWRDAESILDGAPTPSAQRRLDQLRRRRQLLIWGLGGFWVLVVVTGVLVGLLVRDDRPGRHTDTHSSVQGWQQWLGLAVMTIGLIAMVIGFVQMWRSGAIRAVFGGELWRAPSVVLSLKQRRGLSKQVLGRAPVDPARLRLARDLAGRLSSMGAPTSSYVGLSVLMLGSALLVGGAFEWVLVVVVVTVAFGGLVILSISQRRRIRSFLDDHTLPDHGAAARTGIR